TVPHGSVNRRRVVVYFGALGLAFLFLEIAFIQRFLLFLHHPVLAIAVVLSGFLLFAGFGSACAGRWMLRYAPKKIVASAVATIAVLGFVYVFALPALVFEPLIGAPTAVKLAASVVLIAALAFPMGIPFPLGVARVGERSPTLIPWAWAINGCASVISAVLATVLAIHFGFTIVVVGAILLYLLAAAAFDF
ncbi:MAG: SAM-dependent methyltransferase, partial [Gammaproteobacteria bacterium]